MPIALTAGTGIPSGTTIGTVTSATSITLVYPTGSTPTASGSVSLVATPSRGHGTTVDIGAYEYTDPPTPLDPLATYYTVTDTSSSASDTGSLPYAIAQANANTNTHGSVIEFDPTAFATQQTIGLASTLQLSETAGPEVIVGPSAGVVISGGNTVGVFKVKTGTNATLSGLTISGGSATRYGGGLYNSGTATLYDVTVSGNTATAGWRRHLHQERRHDHADRLRRHRQHRRPRAAAESLAKATPRSTATAWSATIPQPPTAGGGIDNKNGTTTLSQCTVSGNTAGKGGGGLWTNTSNATTTLSDCTVSGNTAGIDRRRQPTPTAAVCSPRAAPPSR